MESTQNPGGVPIQVDAAFEKVKRFFPSPKTQEVDSAVVWLSSPGFNGRGEKYTVDFYSANAGNKVGKLEFE